MAVVQFEALGNDNGRLDFWTCRPSLPLTSFSTFGSPLPVTRRIRLEGFFGHCVRLDCSNE